MWGAFANLIPTLPDFAGEGLRSLVGGATSKERKNYITDTRKLRKQEYQDMMYSMRKAGLNPILASGATPGHSAAMTSSSMSHAGSAGVGSAMAAHRQAGVAEKKSDSEIGLNSAKTEREKTEAVNSLFGRANILQQYDETKARIENINQATYTSAVDARLKEKKGNLTDAETDKIRQEAGFLTETGGYGKDLEGGLMQFLRPWLNSAVEDYRAPRD